jgi:hypothetical protein
VLFGLIMVLTFTGSLSVAEAERAEVRALLIGALGSNLSWGIVDTVKYLVGCMVEKGRNLKVYRAMRKPRRSEPAQPAGSVHDNLHSAFLRAVKKNPDPLVEKWNKAHFPGTAQTRLRVLERKPFIAQAEAAAPSFEIPAVFQSPMQMGADSGPGDPEGMRPAEERRIRVENQLRTPETAPQRQHQRFDLLFREVHENPRIFSSAVSSHADAPDGRPPSDPQIPRG